MQMLKEGFPKGMHSRSHQHVYSCVGGSRDRLFVCFFVCLRGDGEKRCVAAVLAKGGSVITVFELSGFCI